MNDDLAIKENLPVYHASVAEQVGRIFGMLSVGQNDEARSLMKYIIIYATSVSGTRCRPLAELDQLETTELLEEMGRTNKKAGFSPIQTIRDESLYGLILDRYMEERMERNKKNKKMEG